MIALSQGNVSQLRTFAIAAGLIAGLYLFLQSLHHSRPDITSAPSKSLHKISTYVPSKWAHTNPPRVTKVTTNFNKNDLFESALGTHEAHNSLHGYDLHVLRDRLSDGWTNQAAYLLSLIVKELEKPAKKRTEWLLWFQPDVIVLNPQMPLETFLPPEPEFDSVHFLATRDNHGDLDSGVFFLRVNQWSAEMLLEVLSTPHDAPELQNSKRKDRAALSKMLKSADYRDGVYYQPRHWYNAYAMTDNTSEYQHGDLQLHFHGMGGDKWSGMSRTLDLLSSTPSKFSVPLADTAYPAETEAYWHRIRTARAALGKAGAHMSEPGVEPAFQRLGYATNYEADSEKVMREAVDGLRDAMGVVNGEHAI